MFVELPRTMKALVAYGPSDYRLEEAWPVPECGPRDIIIRTEGCGICTSDLKCLHGAPQYWGDNSQPAWVEAPFIPGHEFLGHVAAVGSQVRATPWATGSPATRSLPAASAASAGTASTGCASPTGCTAISGITAEPWRSTCGSGRITR